MTDPNQTELLAATHQTKADAQAAYAALGAAVAEACARPDVRAWCVFEQQPGWFRLYSRDWVSQPHHAHDYGAHHCRALPPGLPADAEEVGRRLFELDVEHLKAQERLRDAEEALKRHFDAILSPLGLAVARYPSMGSR